MRVNCFVTHPFGSRGPLNTESIAATLCFLKNGNETRPVECSIPSLMLLLASERLSMLFYNLFLLIA